ncbi:hypothetical protein FF1_009893 [Malus domestica]
MSCFQSWPEPIVRVQSLAESGITAIPELYIQPPSKRPSPPNTNDHRDADVNIPVVTHGVNHELMKQARETWREFFGQPLEVKQEYSNKPSTYEGYGSRLGVEKGAILDWSDYYFLQCMPLQLRNHKKWPALPSSCRRLIEEYSEATIKLCGILMRVLSLNLELGEDQLLNAFGGEENIGACLRVSFYLKCPQPDLTLGLSEHSEPGGLTLLLPDENVAGLQVRKGQNWVTVTPVPNAFIVNVGDQTQVLSNAIYRA